MNNKAFLSMDIVAISIITLIVIVVTIMVYFDIIEINWGNIERISKPAECPKEYLCTSKQCEEVGAIPEVGYIKQESTYICCAKECVCPETSKILDIKDTAYECVERSSCLEGEEYIGLRTLNNGYCCCVKV